MHPCCILKLGLVFRFWHSICPISSVRNILQRNMKTSTSSSSFFVSALLLQAFLVSCSKGPEKKESLPTVQDTMLLHDLAQANKNTAATDMDTTIPIAVRSRGESDNDGLVTVAGGSGGAGRILTPSGSAPSGSAPRAPSTGTPPASSPSQSRTTPGNQRISPPRRAQDAPAPTNVPAGNVRPAFGDPCDSPAAEDQRTCLNRSIARSDVDLNRVYQQLIAQARVSGGAELEERFRQRQRAWIRTRDAECRAQTRSKEGELWARTRGRCLGDYSARRTAELQESLNNLRGR